MQGVCWVLTLEPANVFFLFLDLDVIRNHVCELCVNTSLLEVALQESLQVLIQVFERRTSVQALSRPVLLGRLGVGKLRLRKVRDFLDLEKTVLGNALDQEGTVPGLLNSHVNACREAGLVVTVQRVGFTVRGSDTVLGVLSNTTTVGSVGGLVATFVVQFTTKSSVIEIILLAQVLEIGNGKSEADPIGKMLY